MGEGALPLTRHPLRDLTSLVEVLLKLQGEFYRRFHTRPSFPLTSSISAASSSMVVERYAKRGDRRLARIKRSL